MLLYKHALMLYKLYNQNEHTMEWVSQKISQSSLLPHFDTHYMAFYAPHFVHALGMVVVVVVVVVLVE